MRTVLSPVIRDSIWRVEIIWSNRTKHYFGKFASAFEATAWINSINKSDRISERDSVG
jgi:hypothetical protein